MADNSTKPTRDDCCTTKREVGRGIFVGTIGVLIDGSHPLPTPKCEVCRRTWTESPPAVLFLTSRGSGSPVICRGCAVAIAEALHAR
jgi:hypothetical protein